jgi:hypothetical protein
MHLTLKSITIKGIEVTPEEAHQYLVDHPPVLPAELAMAMIDSYIKRKGKLKRPVPSNRS